MKDPILLESALRALYQSGMLLRPFLLELPVDEPSRETRLWQQSMQAAKEALESEPTQCECTYCRLEREETERECRRMAGMRTVEAADGDPIASPENQ